MDDYDAGDYLEMDPDWIYVEDDFDLADELVENVIPDPGYVSELAYEGYDFDFYGYNEDLEYGEDAYWDTTGPIPTRSVVQQQQITQQGGKTGSKRKRVTAARTSSSKKQKMTPAVEREAQPVLFRSRKAVSEPRKMPVKAQNLKTFALLPDWKERFKDEDGVVHSKHMPAAMAKAADGTGPDGEEEAAIEGAEDDANGQEEEVRANADGAEWEDQEDEGEDEGEEEEDGQSDHGLDIDPEQLKAIIAAKLAEAGISGAEEGAFMQSINDMLTGDGKGEAAAALLEKAAQSQSGNGSGNGRKRKADSAIDLEPESKKRGKKGRRGEE